MLDAEADKLVNAERYARNEERKGYRSGHYERSFTTTSGEINIKMPKLKGLTFETSIIERYKRRETSVEEALIEMYLAGVSVRRVEDISEALWGTKVSPGTISNLNKKAYAHIEEWRNRKLTGEYPYVFVDGIFLKRCWGGEFENCSVLIAIGVNKDGYREILGACEGLKEDLESWKNLFVWLKSRGLSGVKMITGDKALGMTEAIGQVFPDAKYQRCTVHFLSECVFCCSKSEGKGSCQNVKSDPCPGGPGGGTTEGSFGCRKASSANYAQTECQFRYCGTAIPFLTVRSTAR